MMVISLLPVAGQLLKQLCITLLIPFAISSGQLSGETVTPDQYRGMMAESVGLLVKSDESAKTPESADSSENSESGGSAGTSESKSSPKKVARKISATIDSVVARVEPKMDADSILNVTIGLPVPDRTDDDTLESVTTAISSINHDWDSDRIEKIAMIVTLIITVICFGLPFLTMIVIIGLILKSRIKYQRERLRVIENIVTSGHRVPAELTGDRNDPVERRKNYSSAVKWIAAGMALTLFFGLLTKSMLAVATFGLIPTIVGLAKLALFIYDQYMAPEDESDNGGEPPVFPPQFTGLRKSPDNTSENPSRESEIDIEAYHSRFMPKDENQAP